LRISIRLPQQLHRSVASGNFAIFGFLTTLAVGGLTMLKWISFVVIIGGILFCPLTGITLARSNGQNSHKPSTHAAPTKRKSPQKTTDGLTSEDLVAIRALDSKFVHGWLNDDMTAVLSVFAPDAVLFPPGSNLVRGLPAIRSYWWPQDGSHTRITSFDRHIEEIEGTRHLAFLRGTASLSWTYEKDGHQTSQTSRSIDLLLLTRDSAGHWHVIRQMWSTLPS
jgi:ketosteroid isomerase-like protein